MDIKPVDGYSGMGDTQLPRFQVFLQARPGQPYQDAGSVHAPDSELALLNARDVFVRRPECSGLWVIPAQAIFSRTRQQLETNEETSRGESRRSASLAEPEPYFVTCKPRPAGTQTLLGEVLAASPGQAMEIAMHKFQLSPVPETWWVFPARLVVSSDPAEADSWFGPAQNKPFRLSTDFHTLTEMRQIKDAADRKQQPAEPSLEET